jgi:hypothetical protein
LFLHDERRFGTNAVAGTIGWIGAERNGQHDPGVIYILRVGTFRDNDTRHTDRHCDGVFFESRLENETCEQQQRTLFFAFILHLLLCSLGDREWVTGMWWVGLSIYTLYQKGSLLFPFRQSERGRSH